MRRSFAPSSRSVGGKGRCESSDGVIIESSSVSIQSQAEMLQQDLDDHHSAVYQVSLSKKRARLDQQMPATVPLISNNSADEPSTSSSDGEKERYFSVLWARCSTRKHKKWEADGLLRCGGRTAALYSVDGDRLAQSSGFQRQQITELTDGGRLVIGGKEIEVQEEISRGDFERGCNQGVEEIEATEEDSSANIKAVSLASKPFSQPLQQLNPNGHKLSHPSSISWTKTNQKAIFLADAPNALVMPALPEEMQPEGTQIETTVVVDPDISKHLRPHQRQGDEMGLGKSVQTVALLWTLFRQGPIDHRPLLRRILLVAPTSLIHNWQQEFSKWLGEQRMPVFVLTKGEDLKKYVQTSRYNPVLILTYDMVLVVEQQLKEIKFDILVCDEGHRLKNAKIKTNAALTALPIQRRILLTGTPIQNDLQEFYALMSFVNPGILGPPGQFRKEFEEPITAGQSANATEEQLESANEQIVALQELTESCFLRRNAELNDEYLPPKTDYILFCLGSAVQLRVYKRLLAEIGKRDGNWHFSLIDALRKLCNHPVLLRNAQIQNPSLVSEDVLKLIPSELTVEQSGKMTVLVDLLETIHHSAPKDKVVIVSNFTQTLDVLGCVCAESGFVCVRLDGTTATADRLKIVRRFNHPLSNASVLLLSSKAGGQGLNLIGACRLILYDVDWNPANDQQAMARIWRDGQPNHCHIYRLVTTGTIEEKILQRQVRKLGLSDAVMDGGSGNNVGAGSFTTEELKDLFTLHSDTDCHTHELIECKCDTTTDDADKEINADECCPSVSSQLLHWSHIRTDSGDALKWLSSEVDLCLRAVVERLQCDTSPLSYLFFHTQTTAKIEIEEGNENDELVIQEEG